MNYVGLFEGISGFGLAFKRAGANILAVCEIDKTCQSVLRRHHPEAEIHSDVKAITRETFAGRTIDVLAGGFPCQDLSVAGQRKGLAGERSGLWFEFIRIIGDHKPRWVVIENVPGLLSGCGCFSCQAIGKFIAVHARIRRRKGGQTCAVCVAGKRMLESHSGRNLAVVLQGLAECGYGWAYRILDSQYDGVAQRRARVFIVASLGTADCAEILFERESGQWDSSPRREAGQGVAGTLSARTSAGGGLGTDFDCAGGLQPFGLIGNGEYADRPATLRAKGGDCGGGSEHLITPTLRSNGDAHSGFTAGDGLVIKPQIAYGISSDCFDRSGEGRNGTARERSVLGVDEELAYSLRAKGPGGVAGQFGVRRLTPTECERLMSFPDDWTKYDEKGGVISDSARYRMLGNSVVVNTAFWIADRIMRLEAKDA